MNSKERPIIFSTEMVRALLDGRKAQSRRLIKIGDKLWDFPLEASAIAPGMLDACPYGKVGDRLWVREKIYCLEGYNLSKKCPENFDGDLFDYSDNACDYAANFEHQEIAMISKTISPIYMPRWCCRIELVLSEILIEPVANISEADTIAEGLIPKEIDGQTKYGLQGYRDEEYIGNPRIVFARLWNSINQTAGTRFLDNPWVWVLKFSIEQKCN